MAEMYEINPEASFDTLRYWIGYPTNQPLDDLACNRVEGIVDDTLGSIRAFDTVTIEARSEYVLAVVDGLGVQTPPQEVTDRLGGLLSDYNMRWPARPTNGVVELDIRKRHVGTLGPAGAEEDLDRAREFLRERGASSEKPSTEADADTGAKATAGENDG